MVYYSFLSMTAVRQNKTVLDDASQQLWAFLSHPRMFSSSAWAFGLDIKMGWGTQILSPTIIYIYNNR